MSSSPDASARGPEGRHAVVADLGRVALEHDDVDELLAEATDAVAGALDVAYCGAFELSPAADAAVLRDGVGWDEDAVGTVSLSTDPDAVAGRALRSREAVVEDGGTDRGVPADDALAERDVVGGITALVGTLDDPWGVLAVHATEPRAFTDGDAAFVRSVANVLASTFEAERSRREMRDVYGRVSDAVFALDEEWRFTYLNERAEELINPAGRELVGRNVWDEFPEALGREFKPKYERAMYEQETVSFEEYYPEPLDAWFEVRAYPSETGLSVYFRDVTDRKERESELELFRTLIDESTDSVFVVDPDTGRYLDVNDTACRRRGYSREEFLDLTVPDVETELPDRDAWDRVVDELRESGSASFDGYHRRSDGSTYPVEVNCSIVETDREYVVAIARDVTERRERERELRRKERRYQAVFEDPNILVGLLEPDGTVLDINRTAMEYVDADLEAVTGEPFWETPWWGEGDDAREDVREWVERAAGGEYVDFEADLTRPNGDRYVLSGYFRPVTDEDGEVVSVIVSDRDVTERREYERRLAESEQRYRTLAESFPNGLVTMYDEDLRYELAAGRGFEDLPVSPDDVEGRTPREAWGDEAADVLEPALRTALDGEETAVELTYAGRDWILRAVPVTDEGTVVAGMTMVQDITDRKERERALRDANTQLEAATQAGAVGTWEWYVREDRMVAGETFAEAFGVDPAAAREGISLDRFLSAVHEDDRDRVRRGVDAALDACGDYEAEYRAENADGEYRWVVARGSVECDDDGTPVRFPGALTDITDRKRAEIELQRNKEQLESLFEVLPVGVVVADADGRLVDSNDTAESIWGGDVFDADSVAEYERYEATWADSGEPVAPEEWTMSRVLDGETVTDPDVYEIEAADGERRIVSVQGTPVRDDDGNVARGVVTITDVTERRENRRQLAESERRYRTLVEHFPEGAVGLFDEDLRYRIAGGRAFDEVDLSSEDVVGMSVRERYPPDMADRLEPEFEAALEGETRTFEFELHDRHWIGHTVPVEEEAGEISRGMIMVHDVTDRKERERNLRRYETIVEEVNDGVYVVDEHGRFTMVNDTYASMLGYSPEELVGEDASLVVDEETIERVEEIHADATDGTAEWPTMEAELLTADGDRLPAEATFATLPEDDSDWHRVGIVRDVSERKARERRIEESERRYRTLVEHFPEGAVGLFDEDLQYTAVGGELVDEVGLDAADRVGQRVTEIYPEEVVDEVEPHFRAALEGETETFEVEFHGRHLFARTLPVRDAEDEVFGGMLVVQDVTERREYERRLEESNERLEQFAYAASHDLQEPLRMVSSYLQLIERRYGDDLDEDGREFLEYAVDGADRMRDMIDGLLQYSRVDARGDPFEPVDLDDVLADVREDLGVKIEEAGAEITADSLPRVVGDPDQLRQVFQNLLDNAIEYSGDAPPRIDVSAERRSPASEASSDADEEWVISVSDEGIGLDPDDADRVFRVFQSLHSREDRGGTGIGLALCERIVERHGGEIWVDSAPGDGATFSFALPVRGDDDD